ncbi:HNH endonuclease signature motif containing protein [Rhodoferax fermentans]|uniref:HNH nuclease domain-containing protein n=1 Tax=Rhodoferax fermentans TaxID=28066 RepID=A0A1T1ANY4_RHOFE|nr:HNH endonuclease signature motif containing protein [Rhodoferax fermentans]OOV05774.1 hypothetical protein RF819_02780 [Rhodoferax fermentans]
MQTATPSEAERKDAKAAYDRAYRAKNRAKIKAAKAEWNKSATKKAYDAQYRKEHAVEVKAYKDAWYAENRERISAEAKAAHLADPEKRRAKSAEYNRRNAELVRAKTRAWAAANPEKKKAGDRAYFKANRETVLAQAKAWRDANPERKAQNDAAWVKANPLKVKLTKARRRQRVRHATPAWADRRELDAVYTEADRQNLTVDHIIPLKHKLVCGLHVPANLQLLTRSENCRKSNKFDPEVYLASQ